MFNSRATDGKVKAVSQWHIRPDKGLGVSFVPNSLEKDSNGRCKSHEAVGMGMKHYAPFLGLADTIPARKRDD